MKIHEHPHVLVRGALVLRLLQDPPEGGTAIQPHHTDPATRQVRVLLEPWFTDHVTNGGFHKWGTPESPIQIGFSVVNHHVWGNPIYGNPQMGKMFMKTPIYFGEKCWLTLRQLGIETSKPEL